MYTGMSVSQNSRMNCLHIPHGELGGLTSVATPIARNLVFPSVIAFTSAVRSAQIPTGYEAFSTLAPVTHEPSSQRSAAPTRKFEYGPDLLEGLCVEWRVCTVGAVFSGNCQSAELGEVGVGEGVGDAAGAVADVVEVGEGDAFEGSFGHGCGLGVEWLCRTCSRWERGRCRERGERRGQSMM